MRVRPGQVLEIATPRGFAYVQYVSRHSEYGSTIRVLSGFFETRPDDLSKLMLEHAYFAFYPAGAALARGLATSVAVEPIPAGLEAPRYLRRPGATTKEGRVLTWLVIDGDQESLRYELSSEERRLPIAGIWNHEMLVQRLIEEWRPEKEG